MRKLLLSSLLLFTFSGYCQDMSIVKQIDSIVQSVNRSNLKIENDSVINDMSSMGMFFKTYITLGSDSNGIKFYKQKVYGTKTESGNRIQTNTFIFFYFLNGDLIKVEEGLIQENDDYNVAWYYFNDKPYYYTLKNERAADRSEQLLEMAKEMLRTLKGEK